MTIPLSHSPVSSPARIPFLEKLALIKIAWTTLAPEENFAGMTLAEFTAATDPCLDHRERLASLKTTVKAGIAVREIADIDSRLLIKRIVGGVIADAAQGPDSALYRAMGYIRTSERQKVGALPGEAAAPVKARPHWVDLMVRLEKIIAAWTEYAPETNFAGMSLAGFKAAIAPSEQARLGLHTAQIKHSGAVADRVDADAATADLLKRVVAGVKASGQFGDDSPLYRAMGYRRSSERRSAQRADFTPALS